MDGGQFVFAGSKPTFDWTPGAVARLREAWAAGMSGGQIAAELGCTRNSILGKVHRLKLSQITPRASTATKRLSPDQKRDIRQKLAAGTTIKALAAEYGVSHTSMYDRVRRMGVRKPRSNPMWPRLKPVAEAERPLMATQAYGSPCDVLELTITSCRWPITDAVPHLFCNGVAPEGQPYCCEHQRIAYQPARSDIYVPARI